MSRRSTHWTMAAALAGVLAIVAPMAADAGQGPRSGRGPGPGPRLLGEFRGLNLTDTQREQLRSVLSQHRTTFEDIGERLRAAQQSVDAAVTAAVVDESLIRQRVSERAMVEADAAVLRAQVRAQAWQLLTPEQQQQAKARDERRADFMEERREQRQEQAPPQP
jgi:Spy/CpxP family protein refolding chaperone